MFQLPCLITGGYIINLVRVWEPGVFLSPEPQQNYLMGWHEVWLVLSENAVYPTQLRPFHAISINYNPTIRRYWIDLEGLAIIFKRSQLAFLSSPCLEAWVLNAIGLWFFLMKYWGRAGGWSRVVEKRDCWGCFGGRLWQWYARFSVMKHGKVIWTHE